MIRAADLASRLAGIVETVAGLLLPNGKREGAEWVAGSVAGEAGKSLKLRLTGPKAGTWRDFAGDEGGDLIDLWAATRRLSIREAMSQASDYLGIREHRVENPRKTYAKPTREDVSALLPQHAQWLREVRKLDPETLRKFKLASRKGAVMFPYIRDGELVAAKYRQVPKKEFWTDKDCEPCLFGWHALDGSERAIAITEGELDAMALSQYGFAALSVPFGGGKDGKQVQWIENEHDRLAVFDVIFLALDADEQGEKATAEIVKRLGRERCRLVKLPRKDANDCLIAGVTRDEIAACFLASKTLDPESLRQAADYADELEREFAQTVDTGIPLPWRKADAIRLRRGEVSIWAGVNGHGKSQTIGHVALYATKCEARVCVASMEFRPVKWLKRIVRQATGLAQPSRPYIRHIAQWFRDKLWVFEATGTAKAAILLEVFAYAARRYGIELFVIDNLAKCGFDEDDYNGQKAFVDRLTDLAREYQVHVALVCHMRKGSHESEPADKMAVKGSGAITDMADTLMLVWRNKAKEEAVRKAKVANLEPDADVLDKPDAILTCGKQRNGEDEPKFGLWYDRASCQYLESSKAHADALIRFDGRDRAAGES